MKITIELNTDWPHRRNRAEIEFRDMMEQAAAFIAETQKYGENEGTMNLTAKGNATGTIAITEG